MCIHGRIQDFVEGGVGAVTSAAGMAAPFIPSLLPTNWDEQTTLGEQHWESLSPSIR